MRTFYWLGTSVSPRRAGFIGNSRTPGLSRHLSTLQHHLLYDTALKLSAQKRDFRERPSKYRCLFFFSFPVSYRKRFLAFARTEKNQFCHWRRIQDKCETLNCQEVKRICRRASRTAQQMVFRSCSCAFSSSKLKCHYTYGRLVCQTCRTKSRVSRAIRRDVRTWKLWPSVCRRYTLRDVHI